MTTTSEVRTRKYKVYIQFVGKIITQDVPDENTITTSTAGELENNESENTKQ